VCHRALLAGAEQASMEETAECSEAVGVDVLVHVAGGFELSEPVSTLNRESWMRMTDLNAWSLVAVTQHLVPAMLVQGAGKVVAVTARGAASGAAEM
jgi:NADP-dependent 3-hydroxy acid dehydrogenase YdfG